MKSLFFSLADNYRILHKIVTNNESKFHTLVFANFENQKKRRFETLKKDCRQFLRFTQLIVYVL